MAVRDYVARYIADLTGYKLDPAITDTEQLERATDSAADAVVRDFRRMETGTTGALGRFRRTLGKSKEDAKETGREVGNEFAQNLGQSLASGDASTIVQDSAGGLIGSLTMAGPIGLAASAGLTIGLALWNSFAKAADDRRKAVLEAASTIYQGLIDQGAAYAETYRKEVLSKFFDPNATDADLVAARKAGERTGVNIGEGLAKGAAGVETTLQELRRKLAALPRQYAAIGGRSGASVAFDPTRKALQDQIDYLQRIQDEWRLAQDAADAYGRTVNKVKPGAYRTRGDRNIPVGTGGRA